MHACMYARIYILTSGFGGVTIASYGIPRGSFMSDFTTQCTEV